MDWNRVASSVLAILFCLHYNFGSQKVSIVKADFFLFVSNHALGCAEADQPTGNWHLGGLARWNETKPRSWRDWTPPIHRSKRDCVLIHNSTGNTVALCYFKMMDGHSWKYNSRPLLCTLDKLSPSHLTDTTPDSFSSRMTMRSAVLLTICTLSAVLLVARGSEKPSAAPVVAVGVAAASDLIRSSGHRYLDVRWPFFFNYYTCRVGWLLFSPCSSFVCVLSFSIQSLV